MSKTRSLVRNLFRRREVVQDLDEEVQSYLQILTDEKVAAGMPPAAARREARVEFGGVDAVKEAVHSISAGSLLRELWQDLRYAARTFSRQPGFLCIAVITIALGIGLNSSIFSIFNSLLLRPLPAPGSSALVSMYQTITGGGDRSWYGGQHRFSFPQFVAYRDQNHVFTGLAAYHPEFRVLMENRTQETEGQVTSCNYFSVLQASMALGRGFSESECNGKGTAAVVVLSESTWREQFGSDAALIGRTIRMNRVPVTVIGVAGAGFAGTDLVSAAFWVPLPMMKTLGGDPAGEQDFRAEKVSWLELIGRRKEGTSLAEVRANLSVIAKHLDQQIPGQKTDVNVTVTSLIGGPERRQAVMGAAAVVLVAVGLVLMIACANLANLMLARASARGKEIAMRLALGASRGRLVRQLLTESLVITVIGGVLGVLFACWSGVLLFRMVLSHLPDGAPPVQIAVSSDWRVAAYAFVLTMLAGMAFGLAPALQATRPDLNSVLKREGAGFDVGKQRGRGRGFLVGGQVAVCMVLLIASGLLIRALERAQNVDPGFTMRGVALISYDLGRVGYKNAQAAEFNAALADRLRSVPNVRGVVLATGSPLGDRHFVGPFGRVDRADQEGIAYLEVSPGFFSLVDIPLLRGRDFSPAEVARETKEVIVSDSLARGFWPGEDPIGKFLRQGSPKVDLQVIGVAKDAEVGELGDSDQRFVYLPPAKSDALMLQRVLVRYEGDFAAAENVLRSAAKSLDPALKVDVSRLEDNLGPYRAISRMTATISGTLGLLALALAMVGLYGTVAYGVSRRTREIGVRVALGAEARDVLVLMIRQAMRPVVIGALVGVGLCAATSRILSGLLFGVSPHDAITFAGVPLLLVAIAVVATWLPARRALKVDPVVALREN